MNKIKIAALLIILCVIIAGFTCGTAYAGWVYDDVVYDSDTSVGFTVPDWDFLVDSDFAKVGFIDTDNLAWLEPSQETSLVFGSAEAIRLTNTAGTQSKSHIFIIDLDRDYTVGEIRVQKVSFDYYYAERNAANTCGKGFPKVELLCGSTTIGNVIGGDNATSAPDLASYTAVDLGNGWWHLEYFISAMIPTFVDHQDSLRYNFDQVIDGIKVTDSYIKNYSGNTAFVIVDNFQISSAPCIKLGLFNRTSDVPINGYYWVKVAWAGEINSVNITFDDDTLARYTPSDKSPFYIYGLKAGTVTITVTMDLGDKHQILTLTRTLTVK